MKLFVWFVVFILADMGAYFSVPRQIRLQNEWAVIPGCGYVLAAEYHFGNKLMA